MISSEVQRTLVKSPPELWAEISDPDALARHLGEFGEIRITRVQPEQKVEWEAPEASGSIVIKPSGWGTKVKLTVTRELSEAEAGDGSDPALPAGGSTAIDDTPAGVDMHVADEQAPNVADAEPDAHGEAEVAPDAAPPESLATEPPIPIAAIEDGLDEAGLDDAELDDEDEDEEPTIPLAGSPAVPPEHSERPEPEPEPRRQRGFFARLFGRRRAAHAAEADDGDVRVASAEPVAALGHTVAAEPAEDDDYDEPDLELSEISIEDALPAAPAQGQVAVETEADLDVGTAATPAPDDRIAPADAAQADGASEHLSPAETAASLAAELEQAEEAATEQVTAVLTGVLDRLGAAHHRPFSRA